MFKIRKASQIHDKNEGIIILEDKFHSFKDATQSKLGLWIDDIEKSETKEWSIEDHERWTKFKYHYMDEFEDKIQIIDEIMEKKKDKVRVTWISVLNRKY